MTNPDRIEELLNRFGQTITDLPKAQTADYAYSKKDIGKAYEIATEWHGRYNSGSLDTGDYICHQSDVIDKLVSALEKAYTYWEEQKKYYDRITCAGLDKVQV